MEHFTDPRTLTSPHLVMKLQEGTFAHGMRVSPCVSVCALSVAVSVDRCYQRWEGSSVACEQTGEDKGKSVANL